MIIPFREAPKVQSSWTGWGFYTEPDLDVFEDSVPAYSSDTYFPHELL